MKPAPVNYRRVLPPRRSLTCERILRLSLVKLVTCPRKSLGLSGEEGRKREGEEEMEEAAFPTSSLNIMQREATGVLKFPPLAFKHARKINDRSSRANFTRGFCLLRCLSPLAMRLFEFTTFTTFCVKYFSLFFSLSLLFPSLFVDL